MDQPLKGRNWDLCLGHTPLPLPNRPAHQLPWQQSMIISQGALLSWRQTCVWLAQDWLVPLHLVLPSSHAHVCLVKEYEDQFSTFHIQMRTGLAEAYPTYVRSCAFCIHMYPCKVIMYTDTRNTSNLNRHSSQSQTLHLLSVVMSSISHT